ncbi:translation elongation factor 2-like [Rhynchophorus ferrugineus]|uniref:translation elongation factor 2-like n=1 Tax=Rhynchophorus ferrugineus TaxID=354439 RepID=UPI003FCD2873
MVPSSHKVYFYDFGPVFSEDLNEKTIQGAILMMGRYIEVIEDVPSGNIYRLFGVDQFLVKPDTIPTFTNMQKLNVMKFGNPADSPKLLEGLRRLANSDLMVQCVIEEPSENIIAGAREFHLEISLRPWGRIDHAKEENEPFLSTLRVILRCENKYKDGKQFSGTWLPASGTLLQMIAVHLPSPVTALIYRMEMLYEGTHDNEAASGIKNCDPNGPMIMCLKWYLLLIKFISSILVLFFPVK